MGPNFAQSGPISSLKTDLERAIQQLRALQISALQVEKKNFYIG